MTAPRINPRIEIDWDGDAAGNRKIQEDVLTILSTALFVDDHRVKIPGDIGGDEFRRVEDALRALGGTWSRRSGTHAFPISMDARSAIERAIAAGTTAPEAITDLGLAETPEALAAWLIQIACAQPGDSLLEPSAGSGRIVDAALATGAVVSAVERRSDRRAKLTQRTGPIFVTEVGDFMEFKSPRDFFAAPQFSMRGYDRVVMHPPVKTSQPGDHLDHVRRAHSMLDSRGVLAAILPASTMLRLDARHVEFRAWCRNAGASVTQLPDGSLRESGTDMRVIAIRIQAS